MSHKSAESLSHAPCIVGFDRELAALSEWLDLPCSPARIFSISGIGGIGKTTLLTAMAAEAKRRAAVTLWMDGQIGLHHPRAFLSHLQMSLETEYGRTNAANLPPLAHVVSELARQRTVVLIDNVERIDQLGSWLLSSLLPRLAAGELLLIVASRTGLPLHWHTDPAWGSRIASFPLKLLSRRDVQRYVRSTGLPPLVQQEIVRKTEGHPLLLALTVDMMRRRGQEREQQAHRLPRILSAEMLKEASAPRLYEALQLLSLLPAADQTLLNELLDPPLSVADYMALAALSCVRSEADGLALHGLAAGILREDYKKRDPGRYHSMRSEVLERLAERYPSANRLLQMRIAAHTLELYREQLPAAHPYADFSSLRQREPERETVYRSEDLPELQRLLAVSLARSDWQSELVASGRHALLLNDIAGEAPESIRVIRQEDGRPLAFCAGLRLHRQTLSLLDPHASEDAALLDTAFSASRDLPPEAADTLCILLAAVDVEQSLYGPEELGGILFRSLALEAMNGLRMLVPTADLQLNALLPGMGFEEIPIAPSSNDRAGLHLWELDFRQATFEVWIRRILRQNTRTSGAPDRPGFPALSREETRHLLEHLYEDAALEELASLQKIGCTGAKAREWVLHFLEEGSAPSPLTDAEQHILRESYVRRSYRKSELAESLHMSRATFYRHLQRAFEHLGYAFAQTWGRRPNDKGKASHK
ncbi:MULTISPECIES: bacterio-opsin activator [Saccharibacillus]|uniref:bacterio-opsin activator n=1 Tax=Saccharibacillus TaxID=456492 RepID=UPI0012396FEF|nr:bacterio-opsin activator [Saccharibacillus sp. WB 17]MWJ31244.1 bacterio-opsin activator [Saccharibacillus sp. WB 17]